MQIKVQPDEQKASALKQMAEITLARLKETDIEKYPANTLTDYYDAIHKLMEAITAKEGIKIKGEGAHQEIIDYISKKLNLGEQTRIFLQDLRDKRNRISYEGLIINKEFISENRKKIEEIIKKLT